MSLTFEPGECPVCGSNVAEKPAVWTVTTPAGTFCERHVRDVR